MHLVYIPHYFESPVVIYHSICLFLTSKIQLVLSLRSFTQKCSPDLLFFFVVQSILSWMKKRWKPLGARSSQYDWRGWINQPKSNILTAWFLGDVLFEDFYARIATVESLSVHWVSHCCLKTSWRDLYRRMEMVLTCWIKILVDALWFFPSYYYPWKRMKPSMLS